MTRAPLGFALGFVLGVWLVRRRRPTPVPNDHPRRYRRDEYADGRRPLPVPLPIRLGRRAEDDCGLSGEYGDASAWRDSA